MRSLHDAQMEQKIDAYVRRHGLEALPPEELADAILRGAGDFHAAISRASVEQLQQIVTIPFGPFPLFVIADVLAKECAVHLWDMRSRQEPGATIPARWAVPCAGSLANWIPYLANREGASMADGTYLLQVDDGVAPVTVIARDGEVTAEAAAVPAPDVVLHLTADQYLRLATGRLDIVREAAAGALTIDGDPARAAQLNQIFQGI